MTLKARWVTLRARWVTLKARWVTLRARWVTYQAYSPLRHVQLADPVLVRVAATHAVTVAQVRLGSWAE